MSEHSVLLAVQRQVAGLVAEKAALQAQIAGLVAERDALRAELVAIYASASVLARRARRGARGSTRDE